MSTVLYTVMSRDMMFNGKTTISRNWQTDDPESRLLYKIFQNY